MGTQTFPSGTVTAFRQTSAPVGWVKIITSTDSALRIVGGTGGGVVDTGNFFSALHPAGSQGWPWTVTSTGYSPSTSDGTLAELPNHSHRVNLGAPNSSFNGPTQVNNNVGPGIVMTFSAGTGQPDGGSLTNGANGTHAHTVTVGVNGGVQLPNWSLKYVDVIIAYKV
jgi:hypothetical protein